MVRDAWGSCTILLEGASDVDGLAGGSYSFPPGTTSTSHLSISNKVLRTKLQMTGMRVCSSCWSCGTRMTLQYTFTTVRNGIMCVEVRDTDL